MKEYNYIWNENLRRIVAEAKLSPEQIGNHESDLYLGFKTVEDATVFQNKCKENGFRSERFVVNEGSDFYKAGCRYGLDFPFQWAPPKPKAYFGQNGPTGHGDVCHSDADPGL